ncbi:LASP1 protein, partial [Chloropsis hardwickii]|nr:LASP1 protein [Chloropsis hardwickii]
HYPKQSFTMVADTPENLRLKQQSELQSQIRYKEEFEKNKGKGFSVVADTPELQRIRKTQDQISNVSGSSSSLVHNPIPPNPSSQSHPPQSQSTIRSPPSQSTIPSPIPVHAPSLPVYQQQQPPPSQSYGYKEPAAPGSSQRSTPAGGGVSPARPQFPPGDEVSFQDGDTIINVQQIDDGWMYGTVERTGDTGMLPANYVEAI